MKILHWFREDLRLLDNAALDYAANLGDVAFVYIYPEGLGGASRWWLHHSLESLRNSLNKKGAKLVLRTGDPKAILPKMATDCGASLVSWGRVYSPIGVKQGTEVKEALQLRGVQSKSFNTQLLIEPTNVFNKQGTPFKVFTPFWRHCSGFLSPPAVVAEPSIVTFEHSLESENLKDWGLLPTKPNWASQFPEHWQPGEDGAQTRWAEFLENKIDRYSDERDTPSVNNTSLLSPHMVFGELSAKQLWHDIQQAMATQTLDTKNGQKFLAQLGWREFSRYLLIHFPQIEREPFNPRFNFFPWADDDKLIDAWKHGTTGYPIVDAGMRELWQTGYMHNRVRMVVASFLTKHCLSHWQHGMDWFWDTLLDADIGNNTASWQWASGCGADAAPYFRIFNPILQGEKFDANGEYTKYWVPELSGLAKKYLHKPWQADAATLQAAGVVLGVDYPYPIVDHKEARVRALSAYQQLKDNSANL